ncbi:MAG: dihydrolipoamide dehydrogenase [Winogradskyella sp.]|uniref:dihydrolipoamide dehydrogenase n=1 Tax=Winogradskyella sp. TaxID=1883156 RepID=UPI0018172554|nr:dihydrolipoamide dehydrogenase [Winogradskyella sp.]MBT8245895.1 dihydrolipoamide dehydrogenase [Winogradskyella sp.]NNK21745.1 dihydrolipoamide dehydrogenase [Winogradskyella sp.]
MKRTLTLISVLTLLLTACEGPQGPPGFDGFDGQDGVNFVGQSFEVGPLNFTSSNGYENTVDFPENVFIGEDDMLLAYLLWDENPDTWRLLPQTIYTSTGEFQYNFQDNFDNVSIFLDAPASFDFSTLLPGDTENQFFRIVILPIDLINSENINVNDFNSVMNYVELN